MPTDRSLFTKVLDSLNTGEEGSYGYFTSDEGIQLAHQAKQSRSLENIASVQKNTSKQLREILEKLFSVDDFRNQINNVSHKFIADHFSNSMYQLTGDIIENQLEISQRLYDQRERIFGKEIIQREDISIASISHREKTAQYIVGEIINTLDEVAQKVSAAIERAATEITNTIKDVCVSSNDAALAKHMAGEELSVADSNIIKIIFGENGIAYVSTLGDAEALLHIINFTNKTENEFVERLKEIAFERILEIGNIEHFVFLLSQTEDEEKKQKLKAILQELSFAFDKEGQYHDSPDDVFDARLLLKSYGVLNDDEILKVEKEQEWRIYCNAIIKLLEEEMGEFEKFLQQKLENVFDKTNSVTSKVREYILLELSKKIEIPESYKIQMIQSCDEVKDFQKKQFEYEEYFKKFDDLLEKVRLLSEKQKLNFEKDVENFQQRLEKMGELINKMEKPQNSRDMTRRLGSMIDSYNNLKQSTTNGLTNVNLDKSLTYTSNFFFKNIKELIIKIEEQKQSCHEEYKKRKIELFQFGDQHFADFSFKRVFFHHDASRSYYQNAICSRKDSLEKVSSLCEKIKRNLIKDVDIDTFVEFRAGEKSYDCKYAYDKDYVYSEDKRIGESGGTPLVYVENKASSFLKNGKHVFLCDEVVKNADPDTFELIKDSSFQKDKNNLYFSGEVLKGGDPNSFELCEGEYDYSQYIKDKSNVYFIARLLGTRAKNESLCPILMRRDQENLYKVDEADPESFNSVGFYYGKDKKNVFYMGAILKEADPKTFGICTNVEGFEAYFPRTGVREDIERWERTIKGYEGNKHFQDSFRQYLRGFIEESTKLNSGWRYILFKDKKYIFAGRTIIGRKKKLF